MFPRGNVFSHALYTFLTLQHPRCFINYFTWRPVPHILQCDENPAVGIYHRNWSKNFPTYPSFLYKVRREVSSSIFRIFNLSRSGPRCFFFTV